MRLLENPSRHICIRETMFTVKPATMIFGVEFQEIILEKPKMYHPLRFIFLSDIVVLASAVIVEC